MSWPVHYILWTLHQRVTALEKEHRVAMSRIEELEAQVADNSAAIATEKEQVTAKLGEMGGTIAALQQRIDELEQGQDSRLSSLLDTLKAQHEAISGIYEPPAAPAEPAEPAEQPAG
ncbi:MAG TPA: hypothetical protein VFU47_12320 [Armatimonadota bacterium]|nr:hypothetical protein [Armatimonadota bacterium]